MKVKGKSTNPDGRFRGTDVHGNTVHWTSTEQEVDLSDAGYWQCKDDSGVVMIDIDKTPPQRPQPGQGQQPQGDPAQLAQLAAQAQAQGYMLVPSSPTATPFPAAQASAQQQPGTGHSSTVYGPSNPGQGATSPSLAPAGATEPVAPAPMSSQLAPGDAQGNKTQSASQAPSKK